MRTLVLFALCGAFVNVAMASNGPTALTPSPAAGVPLDQPYIGTLTLSVDATDTRHKLFSVRETIPVKPDTDVTLLYPQWETASHAPTGAVGRLAGLMMHAGAQALDWKRDPYNPFAFTVHIPRNAHALDLRFQYLSPTSAHEGPLSMTPALINVQWQSMLLYPAGFYARDINVDANLTLPTGFNAFTSLDANTAGNSLNFASVSLETLVDSPVYAGLYTRRIPLTADRHPVYLNLLGDSPAALAIDPSTIENFRLAVRGTEQLFGLPPWQRYEMLVSLSDIFPGPGGTEHLSSGENNLAADFFTQNSTHLLDNDLIWHELVHAWNGKHRVPEGLWTPNFNTAANDQTLWVYEGQTQFWGEVVAARFGLRSRQDTLDMWAYEAASAVTRSGRSWKSLADSSLDPVFDAGHHVTWLDWQRREDYYLEGSLFWLDVDATLREKSNDRHSLNDFAHTFFQSGDRAPISTYSFAELCGALNRLAANDWSTFLKSKLNAHSNDGLLAGLTKNGYALAFSDTPTPFFLQHENDDGVTDFMFSIGLTLDAKGIVRGLAWNGPAFRSGISIGTQLVSVGDETFSTDALKRAVTNSAQRLVHLKIKADGETSTVDIDYRGPLRYPRLVRIAGTHDGLEDVLRSP